MAQKGTRVLFPQSIWDEDAVMEEFTRLGINKSHHDKFMRSLYDQFSSGQISKLDEFTVPDLNLSPKVLQITKSPNFTLMTTKVIKREDSKDKSTTKLLIELQDGEQIETVLMRYSNTQTQEHTRTTICVSCQIGCAQACSFCATGMLGLTGTLTSAEIIEQFVWCDSQVESIRNVVMMGMGENLSKEAYPSVLQTIKVLTANTRFSLRQNRVTVSTVGIVDNMYRIIDAFPGVTIALSLHAPTQTMRQQIVPSARKHSLKELVDCIDYYFDKTKKKMLIEYVMLDDVNCSEDTAHLLGQLLQNRGVLINLIPFNPVLTKAKHIAPSHETVGKFAEIVASYGLVTTTRKEFGQDISGACGQLSSSTKTSKQAEKKIGYMITDDFTPEQVSDIRGYDDGKDNDEKKEEQQQGNDDEKNDNNDNEDNQDEDDDVVDNGLEGIVSAFGWMNPEEGNQDGDDNGQYIDNSTLGVTRESILDNTTTCGGEPIAAPNSLIDMEDIMSEKKPQSQLHKPKRPLTLDEKLIEQAKTPVCEDNCGCHRELKHKQATEGCDPKDVMGWSLAVLSLGPILKKEQNIALRKKGETEKARLKRLVAQQLLPIGSNDGGNMDECVVGGEEDDFFDENSSMTSHRIGANTNDNLSQATGITGISMTSSVLRSKGPVSSLKIQPREKDLLHRIVIPNPELVKAVQEKSTMDLTKAGWDDTPQTYKHVDDDQNKKQNVQTTAASSNSTNNNNNQTVDTQQDKTLQQQQQYVLAVIAILFALLLARRVM
jgi:sorting nexin-8